MQSCDVTEHSVMCDVIRPHHDLVKLAKLLKRLLYGTFLGKGSHAGGRGFARCKVASTMQIGLETVAGVMPELLLNGLCSASRRIWGNRRLPRDRPVSQYLFSLDRYAFPPPPNPRPASWNP